MTIPVRTKWQKLSSFRRSSRTLLFGSARAFACLAFSTVDIEAIAHETEAQRLDAIRAMVASEPPGRLEATGMDASLCESMLDDLRNRRNFRPVEPVAVLDHEYPVLDPKLPIDQDPATLPPELKRRAERDRRLLGPVLSKGIANCPRAEPEGDFLGLLDAFAGAPPYRVYTLAPPLNPFPEAKLIYWSEYIEKIGAGRKGYDWVNLDTCNHVGGVPSGTDSASLRKDPKSQPAALTTYKGKFVVSWTAQKGLGYYADIPKPPFAPAIHIANCSWATYIESSNKK
jgi:hypothetical protein